MNKYLIYLLIIAFSVIGVLLYSENKLREENKVYASNQTALLRDVEYYKTESGKNAASVQALTLDYKTLKNNFDKVSQTADELDIKLKRIQSASSSATKTEIQIKTVVKDSIIYRDGVIDSLLTFQWRDSWTDIIGEIQKDSVSLGIESTDTLVQIVHRIPHKFWFIKWGTKAIQQEIVSSNPHTKITYSEYIEVK